MAPRAGVPGGQLSWVLRGQVLCMGEKSSRLSGGKAQVRGAGAISPQAHVAQPI